MRTWAVLTLLAAVVVFGVVWIIWPPGDWDPPRVMLRGPPDYSTGHGPYCRVLHQDGCQFLWCHEAGGMGLAPLGPCQPQVEAEP